MQLKQGTWQDARRHVEHACVDQLVKWRGEDDSDTHELEDLFQEIIVLDDDDEDSEEATSETDLNDSDDSSIQIISSPKEAHELVDEHVGPDGWVAEHHIPDALHHNKDNGPPFHHDTIPYTDVSFRTQKYARPSSRRQQAFRQTFRDRYQAAQTRGKERQLILHKTSEFTQPTALPRYIEQVPAPPQPQSTWTAGYVLLFISISSRIAYL